MTTRAEGLRGLPSVDAVLRDAAAAGLLDRFARPSVAGAVRAVLADTRHALTEGAAVPHPAVLLARVRERLEALAAPALRRVVNASGVVLHTNLGRALLAEPAIAAVAVAAAEPVNLELDLATGERGLREDHVAAALCAVSGAEAATVVNNNAAAVLLALNTLAEGREVIVSRGELVEIGGGFRLPEVLAKSGAVLREVGTTNRTHPGDVESAIGPRTALLLKVHPSNYRITGFTAAVSLQALVEIGARHRVPVMEDLGSGALIDLAAHGVPHEPVVAERLRCGADVVTFSGDKLLGGPQAGIAVGRQRHLAAMQRNPLARALRCDKLTLAALEATLRLYRTAPDLGTALPTLRWLTRPLAELEQLGRDAALALRATLGPAYEIELIDSACEVGSGAQPTAPLPSKAITITHAQRAPLAIAAAFRAADPPIIGRVHGERFVLDLRCVTAAADLLPHWREPARTPPE